MLGLSCYFIKLRSLDILGRCLLIVILAVVGAYAPVMAQTINCPSTVRFGEVISCGSAGTVTINPDGSRTSTGCLAFAGAPFTSARCSYTQPFPPTEMIITVDPATTISSASNNLTVDNFQINAPGNGSSISVFDPVGNVDIGADLVVPATSAAGSYSGAVFVTIDLP